MHDLMKAMTSAASGMRAQSLRLRLVGENIANADTPGFQRKRVMFEQQMDRAAQTMTVRPGPVSLDPAPMRQSYEPGHPLADGRGMVALSNVDPLIEMSDAREAQRSYQASLTVYDQARRMYGSMLSLLRR